MLLCSDFASSSVFSFVNAQPNETTCIVRVPGTIKEHFNSGRREKPLSC